MADVFENNALSIVLFLSDVMAMMLHATIYFSLCVSGVCEVVVNATLSLVGATLPPCTKFYSNGVSCHTRGAGVNE